VVWIPEEGRVRARCFSLIFFAAACSAFLTGERISLHVVRGPLFRRLSAVVRPRPVPSPFLRVTRLDRRLRHDALLFFLRDPSWLHQLLASALPATSYFVATTRVPTRFGLSATWLFVCWLLSLSLRTARRTSTHRPRSEILP